MIASQYETSHSPRGLLFSSLYGRNTKFSTNTKEVKNKLPSPVLRIFIDTTQLRWLFKYLPKSRLNRDRVTLGKKFSLIIPFSFHVAYQRTSLCHFKTFPGFPKLDGKIFTVEDHISGGAMLMLESSPFFLLLNYETGFSTWRQMVQRKIGK